MTKCCAKADVVSTGKWTEVSALPVAVIGGGPVGMAAVAHLLQRGLEPILFEAAPTVGAGPLAWGHVNMFSPWRYNIDRASRALLEKQGWQAPDAEAFPTGRDLTEQYLRPLAMVPSIAARLRLGTRVTGIARGGVGKVRNAGREEHPFDVQFEDNAGKLGRVLVQAIIVATGTWEWPAPAGVSGLPAAGELEMAANLRYGMPDVLGTERSRYAGKRVLVIGAGESAIGTMLDLARLADEAPGTAVLWAARSTDLTRAYGGGSADQLPERGALGQRIKALVDAGIVQLLSPFAVDEFSPAQDGAMLVRDVAGREVEVDEAVVATGSRPDLSILREVRLDLDAALECPRVLAPLIDPNLHSCGTVRPHGAAELAQPDTGLFVAGMASYGRAPTFLLATGYEQVRSIAAFLAGDVEASRRVELELPETGVCRTSRVSAPTDLAAESCCTTTTPQGVCCAPKPELAIDVPCCSTAAADPARIPETTA